MIQFLHYWTLKDLEGAWISAHGLTVCLEAPEHGCREGLLPQSQAQFMGPQRERTENHPVLPQAVWGLLRALPIVLVSPQLCHSLHSNSLWVEPEFEVICVIVRHVMTLGFKGSCLMLWNQSCQKAHLFGEPTAPWGHLRLQTVSDIYNCSDGMKNRNRLLFCGY